MVVNLNTWNELACCGVALVVLSGCCEVIQHRSIDAAVFSRDAVWRIYSNVKSTSFLDACPLEISEPGFPIVKLRIGSDVPLMELYHTMGNFSSKGFSEFVWIDNGIGHEVSVTIIPLEDLQSRDEFSVLGYWTLDRQGIAFRDWRPLIDLATFIDLFSHGERGAEHDEAIQLPFELDAGKAIRSYLAQKQNPSGVLALHCKGDLTWGDMVPIVKAVSEYPCVQLYFSSF